MSDWTPEAEIREEPYKVLLKRGEFIDLGRDGRVVPYKIYYPVDHKHHHNFIIRNNYTCRYGQ